MAIDDTGKVMKAAAATQIALVTLGLAGCLLAPRAGGAVLLIPFATHDTVTRDMIRRMTVLRAGAIPRSLLVRVDGPVPVLALLRHGVLPLAAPITACQAPAPDRTIPS